MAGVSQTRPYKIAARCLRERTQAITTTQETKDNRVYHHYEYGPLKINWPKNYKKLSIYFDACLRNSGLRNLKSILARVASAVYLC